MVFYDQRGSGSTIGTTTEESITLDQHVNDLDAIVNSISTKYPNSSIYIIGNSFGGLISGAYTSIHQNKLKGLILIAPLLNIVSMRNLIPKHMIDSFIDPYLARKNISDEDRKFWKEAKIFYLNNSPIDLKAFIQYSLYVIKATPLQGFDYTKLSSGISKLISSDPILQYIPTQPISKIDMLTILDKNGESKRNLETDPKFTLSKITIPSLVFLGESDILIPPDSSMISFETIPNITSADIIEFKKTSHLVFIDQPRKVKKNIIKFIKKINNLKK